jgi:hypothetical protein
MRFAQALLVCLTLAVTSFATSPTSEAVKRKSCPSLVADGFSEIDQGLRSFQILQLILQDDYVNFIQTQRTEVPKSTPLLSGERFSFWRTFFIDLLAVDARAAGFAKLAPALPLTSWCDPKKLRNLLDVSQKGIPEILNSGMSVTLDVDFEAPDATLARVRGMDAFTLRMHIAHSILDVAGANAEVERTYAMGLRNIERVLAGDPIAVIRRDCARERVAEYGMKVDSDEQYLLAKLVLYSRAFSRDKAKAAVEAFQSLPKAIQAILRKELLIGGIDDGWATLLEHGPKFIENLEQEAMRAGQPNPAFSARVAGFTQIARVFQQLRTEFLRGRRGSGMLHVDIGAIASAAKATPPAIAPKLDDALYAFSVKGNQGSVSLVRNIQPMSRNAKVATLKQILEGSNASEIVFVGMGGGSDVMQGAALASLVEKVDSRKKLLGFISVRGARTGSVTAGAEEGVKRTVVDGGKSPFNGVYEILPNTKLPGRSFEPILAGEGRKVYTVLYDPETAELGNQIHAAVRSMKSEQWIKNRKVLLIAIDTGGDVLIDVNPDDAAAAGVTAQQDADVLVAVRDLATKTKQYDAVVGVVAAGIEDPRQFAPVGAPPGATLFSPSDVEKQALLANYHRWQLTPGQPHPQGLYSRTAFAWQLALGGRTGASFVPLPENSVMHPTNPWDPFPYLYPDASGVLFYTAEGLLERLPHTGRLAMWIRVPVAPVVLPDLSNTPVLSSLAEFEGQGVTIAGTGGLEDFAKCVFLARQLRAEGKEIKAVAFVGQTGRKGNPLDNAGFFSEWSFADGLRVVEIAPRTNYSIQIHLSSGFYWGSEGSPRKRGPVVFVDSEWRAYGDPALPENEMPSELAHYFTSGNPFTAAFIAEFPGQRPLPTKVSQIIEPGMLKAYPFNSNELGAFRRTVGQIGASPLKSRIHTVLMGSMKNYYQSRAASFDAIEFGAPRPPRKAVQLTINASYLGLPRELQLALAEDYQLGVLKDGMDGPILNQLAENYGVRFVLVTWVRDERVVLRGRVVDMDVYSIKYATDSGEIKETNAKNWDSSNTQFAFRNY